MTSIDWRLGSAPKKERFSQTQRLAAAMRRCLVASVAVVGLGACGRELPEAPVAGTALDAATLKPLSGVQIRWGDQTTTTGKDGAYTFTMPLGIQELHVSRGDVTFSTLVLVAHTKWQQGLA